MVSNKEKILQLLHSGQKENILLGIDLAKTLNVDIDWTIYENLYAAQFKSAPHNPPLYYKILTLFNSWGLEIKHGILPSFVFSMQQLKSLNLNNNKLEEIPVAIQHLTQLKRLRLENNQLEKLPDELHKLHELEELDLSNNKFKTIPSSVFKLPSLDTLSMNYNQLKTISPKIASLKQLKTLDLSHNQLHSLPDTFGEAALQLKTIHLGYNKFTKLPDSLFELKQLTTLDMDGLKIETISNNIYTLKQLTSLCLLETVALQLDFNRFTALKYIGINGTQKEVDTLNQNYPKLSFRLHKNWVYEY